MKEEVVGEHFTVLSEAFLLIRFIIFFFFSSGVSFAGVFFYEMVLGGWLRKEKDTWCCRKGGKKNIWCGKSFALNSFFFFFCCR